MHILLNQALAQSKFSVFELFYKRAINEGFFIKNNCKIEDEEFWCEFGLVYFGIGLKLLSFIRKGKSNIKNSKLINFLKKAERYFDKGLVFSTSGAGNRSIFWLLHTKCIKKLLESNEDIFNNKKPLRDYNQVYNDVVCDFFIFIGWGDYKTDRENIVKQMFSAINKYKNTVVQKIIYQMLYMPLQPSFLTLILY